jgi:hypothetical protein
MQDIPALNSLLNKSLPKMKNNVKALELYPILISYLFCGRKLYEKSYERNVSPKKKFIDISPLSAALENKVAKNSTSTNDMLDWSKDECAGHVFRVLLRYLSEELSSLNSDLGRQFNELFKKATYTDFNCQICVNNWTTFQDRSVDCFTVQVYLPEDIVPYRSDFAHNPTTNQKYDIHLADAIRLCSNNWKQPIAGMECTAKKKFKSVAIRSDVQSMNSCKVTQSIVYRENPPYVVIEILRPEIVSKAFSGKENFETSVNETSVYIPKTLLFHINSNGSNVDYKKYRFQSAVCVDTNDKKNAHYYVMKPQAGSKYLKMSDKNMMMVEKTTGMNVVQKHACILMYERDEECKERSSEFAFSELVNEFESEILSTPRASQKRKTRSSSRGLSETPAKTRKMSHSAKGSPTILPFLEEKKKLSHTENSSPGIVPDLNVKEKNSAPHMSPSHNFSNEESMDDKDEVESNSDSDNSDSASENNRVLLTTPRGLQEYSILEDDSTFFEQKCVYCQEDTTQFYGKVTYICETCGHLASKLNTKQLEKDIEQIGAKNLHDHCVGCQTKFGDTDCKVYHMLGELKYCVECISTNACKCFICIKGTDHMHSHKVNNLRGLYLFKVSRMKKKQSSYVSNVVNTFLDTERTDDEKFLCQNLSSHDGEYIVNHGGQLLLNKLFQKFFYTSKESLMSWEIVQYYTNLCRDSIMAKENGVIVRYHTDNSPLKQIEDLLRKPRNGIHVFVGKNGENKWHSYEVDFRNKDEVKIVYFDTSESNRENVPFILQTVKSCLNEDNTTVVVNGEWKYTNGGCQENKSSLHRNSALYLIFFLMSRCGNLDTKLDVSKLEAMRQHLLLALVTGEPFYF